VSNIRKPRAAPRLYNPETPAYRDLVRMLDQRRVELGWTHEAMCAKAGIAVGHWSHWLDPDTAGGRLASWQTLDAVIAALYPDGWRIEAEERPVLASGKHARHVPALANADSVR
jgi:hypothetical protein